MLKTCVITCVLFLGILSAYGQKTKEKTICIGFYNTENFFDTIHDPEKLDSDFLPNSPLHYNSAVYMEKLGHISEVIGYLGKDVCRDGVALLGLAEIENDRVLKDLVSQTALDSFHFKFVHYDSPDERGIDVALIYNPEYFNVLNSAPLVVRLYNSDGSPKPTRDILWVYGNLDGVPVHILVNHWPSRRGGRDESAKYRASAAAICRHFTDSLLSADKTARIILMGDLNDDPIDTSVAVILNAQCDTIGLKENELYNPWCSIFNKGMGSLEYDDNWNLFDQIIFSADFLDRSLHKLYLSECHIFNKDFLITHSGRFKGYPHRTYSGKYFIHGYSDHFPVYSVLRME